MKYCSKCGSLIHDEAIVCPKCGCETALGRARRLTQNGSSGCFLLGVLAIILGLFGGFPGLPFGIACIVTDKDKKYTALGVIGIIISSICLIVLILICLCALTASIVK